MQYLLNLCLFLLPASFLKAQPKHLDELVQRGDTMIFLKKDDEQRVTRERYYRFGRLLFVRDWEYWGDGSYSWAQKKKEGTYALLEGPNMAYYPDGRVRYALHYHRSRLTGDCLTYYASGRLRSRSHYTTRGKTDGVCLTYYSNGQVETKLRWANGRLKEILRYKDHKGNDLPIGSFKDGKGDWIWYDRNGQPVIAYTYNHGRKIRTKYVGRDVDEIQRERSMQNRVRSDSASTAVLDTIKLINPSFEIDAPQIGKTPAGWVDLGADTETPPDIQPGWFEVKLPAQDGSRYVGLVVRENNSWEGLGQRLPAFLKKDSAYTFSLYLTRSQKYISATKTSPMPINFNAPTVLKIWGYNTTTRKEELLAESSAVSHSEWVRYTFTLKPLTGDFDELDLLAYYAPGFENKNGNLLIDNCSSIIRVAK